MLALEVLVRTLSQLPKALQGGGRCWETVGVGWEAFDLSSALILLFWLLEQPR